MAEIQRHSLLDFERKVLRNIAGEDVSDLSWGAAMSEVVGYLKGRGFIRIKRPTVGNSIVYEITDAGRAALAGI